MEKLNNLKITIVFIVTIIIPSLFLSAFAYQAVEGERVARRVEEKRRLLDEARNLAREIEAGVRGPAREVRDQCSRLRGRVRRLQDAALLLKVPDTAGVGSLALYAAPDGHRVFPATQKAQDTPPPDAAALIGGSAFLMATPPDAVAILRSSAEALAQLGQVGEKPDADKAAAKLIRLEVGAPAATRTAVWLQWCRLQVAKNDRDALTLASFVLDKFARTPIDLVDPLGRPVGALARLDHALVARSLGEPDIYRTRLVTLVRDLERAALLLPARDLAEIATRAASLLDLEGKDWEREVEKAQECARARLVAEEKHQRQDDLFQDDVRESLRSRESPRTLPTRWDEPQPSVTGRPRADATDPDDPSRWFVRHRAMDREQVLLLAPVHSREGTLLGLAAFPYDVDGLVRRISSHTHLGEDETSFEVTTASPNPGDDDPEVARVALAPPLDHVQVLARHAAGEVLRAEKRTMTLWLIALSIGGIAAGAIVTTRTVLREAKAAELKSDFVTNVTHELRTPLTSIRMFIETLELGRVEDEAETRECLQIMGRETDRLTRLIERLLAFSKIESRKWRFKFSYASPLELVNEAIRLLKRQQGLKDDVPVPIEVEAVQELGPIAVDKDAIIEVLLNLLTNAWKYTPGDNRKIRMVLSARRKQVVIDVEDNGIGVPRRDRRRIWIKFERGSNAEKGRFEGSGIGLTLALSIAKGHGGTITLTPLKQGSRFSLVLPKV